MTNPNDLIDSLVSALQSVPAVVTAVGSSVNIVAYKDSYPAYVSLEQAIQQLNPPAILVAWNQTGTQRSGSYTAMAHQMHLILRPRGSAADLFTLIREGVVTSSGLKFKLTQVNTNCHPPSDMSIGRQLIAVAADTMIDVFIISLTLTERGIDN